MQLSAYTHTLHIANSLSLHMLCHEDGRLLPSIWLSFCHYLTEQSPLTSICLNHSFPLSKVQL